MADHRLRILMRNYEQEPTLDNADRVIQEYRRIFGVPIADPTSDFVVAARTVVTEQQIRDLLVSGFEGGIGYWAMIWGYQFAPGLQYSDFQEGGKMQLPNEYYHPVQLIPLVPGCAVLLVDSNEVHRGTETLPEGTPIWKLDRQALHDGLQVMAEHHLHHWRNFVEESSDAETADVYIQLCLFGEVVYG
jgi:hypothetical protein